MNYETFARCHTFGLHISFAKLSTSYIRAAALSTSSLTLGHRSHSVILNTVKDIDTVRHQTKDARLQSLKISNLELLSVFVSYFGFEISCLCDYLYVYKSTIRLHDVFRNSNLLRAERGGKNIRARVCSGRLSARNGNAPVGRE